MKEAHHLEGHQEEEDHPLEETQEEEEAEEDPCMDTLFLGEDKHHRLATANS